LPSGGKVDVALRREGHSLACEISVTTSAGTPPKYICRSCRNKVPQADLERVFQEQLHHFALSPEKVAASLAEKDEELQAKSALLEGLRVEAGRLKAEADKLYALYLNDELTSRGFGERNRPIEERRVQIDEEIPRLQGEIDFLKIEHLSGEEVAEEALDLYRRWEDLSQEDRRTIVQAIVERVTIGKDEIEISLAYLPRSTPPPAPPPLKMVATSAQTPSASLTPAA
jgi:site-specific DNA recombinase